MPPAVFDPSRFRANTKAPSQYRRQLERLAADGKQVDCIEEAVDGAATNLAREGRASFVIYGEPQSGKTEMMICLTAKLLDDGRRFILHLLNDSVDLLGQNLGRFQKSGLAPSAKNFTDILDPVATGERPVHTVLLGSEIPIVEHMCGLAALPATGSRFFAVPVKVKAFGTFPVRAFAPYK